MPQGSVLGPLLFIIYINDIFRSTDQGKFVLFADDTNIFVADESKFKAYELGNKVLDSIYKYMKCNLLHINYKKCCFMHFKPSRNDKSTDDQSLLKLNGLVIKRVIETKFLGVIIDDKLNWDAHISYLNSKLKCEIGKLHRMKYNIPGHVYKDIYHTLFESHLNYGISVWGGVSHRKLEPLFITQKKCIRILFGDNVAYDNKFKTCARTRPKESQILGKEFYELEHSKPLFNDNNLLTVFNLYKYHCQLEMFKIMKLSSPISLFSIFKVSHRRENLFITSTPSTAFIYQSTYIWNKCHKISKYNNIGFNSSIAQTKNKVKNSLLIAQKQYERDTWCSKNHDLTEFTF